MKALQLIAANRFEIAELPIPTVEADEVLIRVRACGICGSDVHGADGSTGRRIPPIVMGHEAAGEIVELGSRAGSWSIGDRVTFDSTIYCGDCPYCHAGQTNLCDNRQVLGVSCNEYRRQGAFAEFVAVPARVLQALPPTLTFEQAAMVEPVSVAVHAANRAQIRPNDRVAVIGCGMIGLLVVQVLRSRLVREVIAVDLDPGKLDMALRLGATQTAATVSGFELDAAFEAVGITPTVKMAIESVRKGGRVSLIGNMSPTAEIPLQVVVTREITLYGCCASQGDVEASLQLIANGDVKVEPLISAQVDLGGAPQMFERLQANESGLMKVMVTP